MVCKEEKIREIQTHSLPSPCLRPLGLHRLPMRLDRGRSWSPTLGRTGPDAHECRRYQNSVRLGSDHILDVCHTFQYGISSTLLVDFNIITWRIARIPAVRARRTNTIIYHCQDRR